MIISSELDFVPFVVRRTESTPEKGMYGSGIWHGHIQEEKMKERGLVFRTKEEAIETSKKMLEAIK